MLSQVSGLLQLMSKEDVLMGNLSTAQYVLHSCVGAAQAAALDTHMRIILQNEARHPLALLKCFPVNPRPSENEAGFQFNQVKCQLLFIIRNSFNRFPV